MTAEEYQEIREIFTDAQKAVGEAIMVFYELATDHGIDLEQDDGVFDPSLSYLMEKAGLWIGRELNVLEQAQNTLYGLMGKAHSRS